MARQQQRPVEMRRKVRSAPEPGDVLRYALCCGTAGGLAANAAVMLAARAEGRSAWRPLNATSHWFWGERAGQRISADLAHTGMGALTNQSAAMFWGAIFGAWLAAHPERSDAAIAGDAAGMAAIAGAVDYGLVPKRLSPGWELALPPRSVIVGLAGMGLGLALGGMVARRMSDGRSRR